MSAFGVVKSVPVIDRTTVKTTSKSDWLYWKLHEAAGEAAIDEYRGSDSVYQDLALLGTTTNSFDNAGWITPEVVAGNASEIRDNTADAFFNCETLDGIGGIFSWCDFYRTGDPNNSQRECILGYGGQTNGTGQQIEFLNVSWLVAEKVGMYFRNADGIKNARADIGGLTSQRISMATYFDCYNRTISMWLNGSAGDVDVDLGTGALPGPSDSTYRGLCILGYPNTTAGTPLWHVGENNAGTRVSNLGCVRFEYDASSLVAGLALELFNNPNDPPNLAGI